jgi:eukaryotic-like serine/threonine-protein kinase
MNHLHSTDDRFQSLLEQLLAEVRNGREPSLEEICIQHPDFETQLRELLPTMIAIERLKPSKSNLPHPFTLDAGAEIGNYQILREIGRGGMGVVYEAIQAPLGRRVALKLLSSGDKASSLLVERFRREAQIAAQLHHTNIVPVHGAGESGGHLFYAMQFIDGQSLMDFLRMHVVRKEPSQPLAPEPSLHDSGSACSVGQAGTPGTWEPGLTSVADPREVARIGAEIAGALEHAHSQRILHRDIKPSNILIDRQGRAWITDFGLAKPTESPDLTATGDLVGTLRYMAPERFHGDSDARSDIYSLGVTLYEALLGHPAICGKDNASVVAELSKGRQIQIAKGERNIPPDLRTIVNKAMRNSPVDRYSTAGELASDLSRFLENRPIAARRASWVRQTVLWAERNPLLAAVSAALVAVTMLGIVGLAWMWQRSESLREQAEMNLVESQKNLQLAIAAVDQFCDKVTDDPRLVAHDFRPLRQRLLKTAVDFHQQLLARREQSLRPRLDLARAYARLGRLSAEIDSRDQTRQYLEQAVAAFAELYHEDPANSEIRHEYARVVAELALQTDSTGGIDVAEQLYRKAIALMELSTSDLPNDELERARLLHNFSLFLRRHLRASESEAPLIESLEILEKLHAAAPDAENCRTELANALLQLGEYYRAVDVRRWRESESIYKRALSLQEPLLKREIVSSELRAFEAHANYRIASIYRLASRDQEAETVFKTSIEILRPLVADHPSVTGFRASLASVLNDLGELYAASGDYDRAHVLWSESRTIWQGLSAADSSNKEFIVRVGQAQMNAGELEVNRGNQASAMQHFTQATEILRGVLPDAPNQVHAKFLLAASLERRATLYQDQAQYMEASRDWQEAAATTQPLMQPWFQSQAAICAAKSGDHVRAAELAESLATLAHSGAKGHGQSLMNAARALAIASTTARSNISLTESEKSALADQYASRAVDFIKEILDNGKMSIQELDAIDEFKSLQEYAPYSAMLNRKP